MTALTTSAPSAVAAGAELKSQVDAYVRNLPDYRATGYIETNQDRLDALIGRIGRNPDLLADNIEELFNRVTIAKLHAAS